jgi:preprotein translocase subunit SecD
MGRQRWLVGVLVLGAVALLGACSSDDGTSTPDPATGEKVVLEAYGVAPSAPKDLERAATIVQGRLRALGVRDAEVTVKGQQLVATGTGVGEATPKVLQPGLLQFRPVLAVLPPESATPGDAAGPPGSTVLPSRSVTSSAVRYAVGPSALDGNGVASAQGQDLGGGVGWGVSLRLAAAGTDAFNRLAGDLFPKQPPENSVAIVLDGVVQTAPAFAADTLDGDVSISGSFTEAEAKDLAAVLGFGSLPVPLRIAG